VPGYWPSATTTIHHDGGHKSYIQLPLLSAEGQ
jgi:hypothetical protein